MPEVNDETVAQMQARERLRSTDLEFRANVLHNHVKGRLTEDGLNDLFDSLSVGGFKIVRK